MSEGGEVKFEAQLFSQSCEFPSFTKGVRYSPDGTCVLAADDSNTLRSTYQSPHPPTHGHDIPLLLTHTTS